MLLTKFIYPISEPAITVTTVYEQPANTVMAYSRGNPYLDSFFIPSRLVPKASAGFTYEFKAQHEDNNGLYPALLAATSVYITSNTLYAFQDVNASLVAFIVGESSVKVGYTDVTTGNLVIISFIQLTPRPSITEAPATLGTVAKLKRQLATRTTVAPNNLPKGIVSKQWALDDTDGQVLLYTPHQNEVYSYVSLRINASEKSSISIIYQSSEPGAVPVRMGYQIEAGTQLVLDNLIVVSGETMHIQVLDGACNVYAGFMQMWEAA